MKKPLRTRRILKKLVSINMLKVFENAIAIKFNLNDCGDVISLHYQQNGIDKEIQSDIFVVCAGALETPRLIRTLGSRLTNEYPLLDHPQVLLGRIKYRKRVLFNLIGLSKPFIPNARRIGFVLDERVYSLLDYRNISIFLRPDFEVDDTFKRSALKQVLYQPNLKNIFGYFRRTPGAWKVIAELVLEKFGLGFYTRRLAVYAQYEQTAKDSNYIKFNNDYKDDTGRCIPFVHAPNSRFSKECYDNLRYILSQEIINGSIEFIPYEDLVPITGAHFSGTLPLGVEKDNLIDPNLKVKNHENVYVCDASIFPFIGNVNLSLNITKFAVRLAKHFKSRILS